MDDIGQTPRATNVWDAIVICIPTVSGRAAALADTLAQWARIGATPLVETQPDDWPRGVASHRRTAERALRRALDARPAATHVLFCEDDIDLAPELPTWLPALARARAPVTLFLPGVRYYPPHVRAQLQTRQLLDEGLWPVDRQAGWYGSHAVLLPRALAEDVLCCETGGLGWDIHARRWLLERELTLYVTVPNLVQHRGLPTVVAAGGEQLRSASFGRPSNRAGTTPGW